MPRSRFRDRSQQRRSGSRVRDVSPRPRDRRDRSRKRSRSYSSVDSSDSERAYRVSRSKRRGHNRSRRNRHTSSDSSSRSRSRKRRRFREASRRRMRDNSEPRAVRRTLTPPPLSSAPRPHGEPRVGITERIVDSAARCSDASTLAQAIVEAVKAAQPARGQSYFISNFDPLINNIDAWCEEVDRARETNGWSDHECLSRVANCLKGDAKVWISEWVSNDRTWSNFKREFKPLCPAKLDYANILYDAMNNTSDKYATYAEYARRTLLRLRIVRGLDDSLRTLIVIRGIDNAQVRAAAANADLTPDNLVSFLAIYTKPNHQRQEPRGSSSKMFRPPKRGNPPKPSVRPEVNCFNCGQRGHLRRECTKKPKENISSKPSNSTVVCNFCKKPGHKEEKCFAKNRSSSANERSVNLCADRSNYSRRSDITTAVICGVPMDVLIDSGALNVSLVSSDVLKHLPCQPKPRRLTLKGIGEKEIVATSYITVTVEFENIAIETDLVVVPASLMVTPIIIGTDVLNRDGVTFVRTRDRQYLSHSEPIHVNAVSQLDAKTDIQTPLQGEDREALLGVINEYSEYFITGTAITTVLTGEMEITLTSSTPVVYRPYKLSYQEKLKVREITADLLEKGIIRRSNSEYASPIILVKKRDGSDRLCVDFRALNRITVKDRYPLPLIDDQIDRLGTYTFFTSLDMASGFHQIRIKDECVHFTGFVTPEDHFEYLKMPFGLANSPIVYQRIINDTLRSHITEGNTLVYVDDVLLLSNTIAEGIELLHRVLDTLTKAGFSVNLRKCSFLVTEVEYLGRRISRGQVRPSPRKVEALVNTSPPQNVKQVRQLLGLAGYFRRYIKNYASTTAPIAHLTRKGSVFEWTAEHESIRQDLVRHLTSEPVLAIFNPDLPTEVHTDASSIGYGAVLLQVHPDGKKRAVAYFSKVTHGAEAKYHSYELETLAVVKALQNFRHYLVGLKFTIVTDCNALKSTERKKDLLPRVARWWIYLQDFDFSIEYRKGVLMPHADYLSRNPVAQVNLIAKPRNWAQGAQAADAETEDLLQKLQDGTLDTSRYVARHNVLYYRYSSVGEDSRLLCYIPKGHRLSLLRIFHDEHGHIGVDKTMDLILKHFWFPGLKSFVSKYISHCLTCISRKRVPRAPLQNITSWEKPDVPFDTVHIDALGPLPVSKDYKYVLIIVDSFSKYCLLHPMSRQDAEELKKVTTNMISLFGVPRLIVCDKGRMFESNIFVEWMNDMGCDLHYVTPQMHHANGQVERYMRTVLNMIRVEANHKGSSWSDTLWKLQLVINVTKHRTTQVSPLNLLIGTEATTPVIRALVRDVAVQGSSPNREAIREITRSRARQLLEDNRAHQDTRENRRRRPPKQFNIDDRVFVIKTTQSTGKLDPGMRGPYKVVNILPGGRYELRLVSGDYGKTTQAAAQYMVPWQGEWCPEECAAFFNCAENDLEHSQTPAPVELDSVQPSTFADEGLTHGRRTSHVATESSHNDPGLSTPLLD